MKKPRFENDLLKHDLRLQKEFTLRFNPRAILLLCFPLMFSLPFQSLAQQTEDAVKLNQIQVIGTHNSYHAGIAPNESKLWQAKHAEDYKGLDYQHQPL